MVNPIIEGMIIERRDQVLIGFLSPASSIGGAIIHASEWTTPKTIYKYVTMSLILGMIIVMVIVIPFGNMLF